MFLVTTCLGNLEMFGNFTDVREMSGISVSQGIAREKSFQAKLLKNIQKIASTGFLVSLT